LKNAAKHHPELWKNFLLAVPEMGKTIAQKVKNTPTEALI
jgi:hypothetical protein